MISKRSSSIDTSGIRRMFELGASLKDPINLTIGFPAFDALPEVKDACKRAIDGQKNGYTITQGIPELRQKIRARYGATNESEHGVMLTSGVSGGFVLAYMAMLDPGDQVLVPDPFFGMYRDVARLLNAEPVFYDCYPDFDLPLDRIRDAITPRTRVIVVGNPSNPTGASYSQEKLDGLVAIARKAGIWIVYDEIYSAYTYDRAVPSIFGKYENTLVLNGFSKSHGITGWRVGYAVGPKRLIDEMIKLQQYTFVCTPSIVQWAMVEGIDVDLSEITALYRKKRNFLADALQGHYEFATPGGAFYLFAKAPGEDGTKFAQRCLEQRLLVVPGSVFSRRDSHFRISFSVSQETLERGAEVLRALA